MGAAHLRPGPGAELAWGALVVLACVALAARAGAPPAGALLGAGEGLPARVWAVAYAGGALWEDGLTTTRALFPTGARVWPPLEGILLTPVARALGAASTWNLLAALRVLVAGAGGTLVLFRLGLHPAWGLLVAAPVAAGIAPELAWMPLGLALLLGPPAREEETGARDAAPGHVPGLAVGLAAGLALVTDAGAAVAGWIALALLAPGRLRTPAAAAAAVVTVLALTCEAWVHGAALDTAAGEALRTLTPRPDRVAGALPGLLGLGARPWGSPLLLLAVLPLLPWARPPGRADLGRRGAALAAIGALVALGPVLIVDSGPVVFNGRTVPLPFLSVGWLPPAAAAADLVPFALLAWLGAAVAAGSLSGGRRAPLAALALLLLAPAPTWSVPPAIAVAEGPVLEYPVPASGWPLYAAARDDVSTSGGLPGAAPPGLEEVMGREGWSLVALQTWAKTHGFRTLRVDEAAGQGAAVALLLGDLAPIGEVDAAAPAWPDVHLVAHGTPDPVPPLPERPTIPPSDDWAWRDPELVQFLDAGFASRARYLLRLYTSPDGLDWTRAAAPFAHSFTSLGLTMVGDEALIVSGTPGLTASLAREFPRMHPASVMAFTTTDLENWGVRRWWLDRKLSVVDPQIDADADGLRLTAWMRTGALGTDPISLTGDHPVFEARLGADGRFHPETPYASLPWLADPVRVQGWLYATSLAPGTAPRVVILGPGPDGWAEVDSLPGLSVPFVTKPGRTWSMLIHQPEEAGHVRVARSTSLDGRAWWAPIPLRLPEGAGCESPVGAKFRGTFVLLCSERLGGAEIF